MGITVTGGIKVPQGKFSVGLTPSGITTDPDFADVKLLLHMEGEDEGTVFTDSSSIGATPTRGGSSLPVTDNTNFKFGSTSGRFGTTSETTRLTYDANSEYIIGSNDFTMECWYYRPTAGAANFAMLMGTVKDNSGTGAHLRITTSNRLFSFIGRGGAPIATVTGTIPIPLDQFSHIAVAYTRSDTTLRIFVNGVLDDSVSSSSVLDIDILLIGRTYADELNSFDTLPGWVDEARFTNGTARYTANFSVPTEAFPDS